MSMLIDENSIFNTDIGVQEFTPLTDVKANDYFVITILTKDNNEVELIDSTGWTQVSMSSSGGACEVEMWYKKVTVDKEEPTGIENTGADDTWSNLHLIRGLDSTNPIDVADGDYVSTSALAICPSVTSTQDNQILFRVAVSDGQNFTRPTSIPVILFETDFYMGWSKIDAGASGTLEIPLAASDQWATASVVFKRASGDTSTPLEIKNETGGTETLTQITGQTHNGNNWRDIVRATNTTLDIKGTAETWSIDMSLTPTANTRIMKFDNFSTVFPVGDGTSVVTFANGASGTLKKIERYDNNSYYLYFEDWTGNNLPNNNKGTQSGTGYTCLSEGTIFYDITPNMVYVGTKLVTGGRGCYITGMSSLGVSNDYYLIGKNIRGTLADAGYTVLGYWVDLYEDATQFDLSTPLTLTPSATGTATITDTGMMLYDYDTTSPFAYPHGADLTIGPHWNVNVVGNNKVFTTAQDFSEDINVIFTKPYAGNTKKLWFWASDSSGNWKCWLISNLPTISMDYTTFIDFADTEGLYNSEGTFDATDVKYYGTLFQQKIPTHYRAPYGTYDLYSLNTMIPTGGSTEYPIKLWMIEKNINKGARVNGTIFSDYMSTSSPSQFLLAGKLKLGNGVLENTTISAQNTNLSFNPHSDGIGTYFYYVGGYKAGIEIDKCKGDLTYDTIVSDSGWYFTSTDDSVDLSGAIFVNSDCNLNSGKVYENISFVNSPCVKLSNGSGVDNCTINGSIETGTTGAVLVDSADTPTLSDTSIKNSAGYGMRIEGTTSITLNHIIFNNNATKDIYFAATSGTITVTISNSGTTPTYDSAGVTVVLAGQPVEETLTNVVVGSIYQIYNITQSTVITSGTATTSTVYFEDSISNNGDSMRIRVRKSSSGTKYIPYEQNAIVSGNEVNVYVSQTEDTIAS